MFVKREQCPTLFRAWNLFYRRGNFTSPRWTRRFLRRKIRRVFKFSALQMSSQLERVKRASVTRPNLAAHIYRTRSTRGLFPSWTIRPVYPCKQMLWYRALSLSLSFFVIDIVDVIVVANATLPLYIVARFAGSSWRRRLKNTRLA